MDNLDLTQQAHVRGSALALNADVFVSADTRQIQTAARAGLRAEAV
jgi:hypothetical protein